MMVQDHIASARLASRPTGAALDHGTVNSRRAAHNGLQRSRYIVFDNCVGVRPPGDLVPVGHQEEFLNRGADEPRTAFLGPVWWPARY
ncbi:hypothetical protein KZZ52_43520 [Dactylosporangium sp. AC04546]|uniref:hypothetical protein n=1 Tax=Dactylosporangium sp. AC04546 TaxID=2862460 RepID=UPI001EDE0647|nr:hypothetical protein [Dactylosporangium sp. AC04546]WVK80784.1 hypothetical protein KZZ52_43520 [Dactylosporangium sp. AC04546]